MILLNHRILLALCVVILLLNSVIYKQYSASVVSSIQPTLRLGFEEIPHNDFSLPVLKQLLNDQLQINQLKQRVSAVHPAPVENLWLEIDGNYTLVSVIKNLLIHL